MTREQITWRANRTRAERLVISLVWCGYDPRSMSDDELRQFASHGYHAIVGSGAGKTTLAAFHEFMSDCPPEWRKPAASDYQI